MEVYIFSFNRGGSLLNCVDSLALLPPSCPVTIIDDNSTDEETIEIINALSVRYRVIKNNQASLAQKTGGLYSNMSFAVKDAYDRQVDLALFIQDDMQVVRRVDMEDIAYLQRCFEEEKNSAVMYLCFLKQSFKRLDEARMKLISGGLYYLRAKIASNRRSPGYRCFSACGVMNVSRVYNHLLPFANKEHENEKRAEAMGFTMIFSSRPFIHWLPYPVAFRGGRRSFLRKLSDQFSGAGVHPIRAMTEGERDRFLSRNPRKLPYAEEFLSSPTAPRKDLWSTDGGYNNLTMQKGWKKYLGYILKVINRIVS